MNNIELHLHEGLAHQQAGRLDHAELCYLQALAIEPDSPDANYNRGVIRHLAGDLTEAEACYRRAIAHNNAHAEAYHNLAFLLRERGDYPEAEILFQRALELQPEYADCWNNLGVLRERLGDWDGAEKHYRYALELMPAHAAALGNLARVSLARGMQEVATAPPSSEHLAQEFLQCALEHHLAGRLDEAEAFYHKVLAENPGSISAHCNLGLILEGKGNLLGAEACYRQALELEPASENAHYNLAVLLCRKGELTAAEASFRQVLVSSPCHAAALHNLGFVLQSQGHYQEAESLMLRSLDFNPNDANTYANLGTVLGCRGDLAGQEAAWKRALELNPHSTGVLINLGGKFQSRWDFPQAVAYYGKAFEIEPGNGNAAVQLAHCQAHLCQWQDRETPIRQVQNIVTTGKAGNVHPFSFLTLPSSAAEQLSCARQYAATLGFQPLAQRPASAPATDGRLRIAYLSGDFRGHATAFLMAELFELHDKSRFEIFAYSWSPDDGSKIRARLERSFEHFHKIEDLSDEQAADLIRQDGIDILIDLKGYTEGHRAGILARRPAPIQAQFLGYPGTMGTVAVDYLIADEFIIPESHFQWYDEKIVWLPDTYQPNDRKRDVGIKPTRAAAGLPPDGVIFCAFHQSYKITPEMFDLWMNLLLRVPGSVLWLLRSNQWFADNLQQEAAARGVDPLRLIFAPPLPLNEHLGRLQLADIFLDTLPCNAHTTTSDALWAGVLVVTLPGQTFASRVAGSLLHAAGLPELVTSDPEEYENLAYTLATEPGRRAALRSQLASSRDSMPLFDAPRYTHSLETAIEAMWQRQLQGLPPDHIKPCY